MFIIDNNITKDDILGYLSAQLKSGQPAVIFLYELPPYLSSKIAFDKFLRAVSKYPRPITWQTHDEDIAQIITQTHKVKPIETENLGEKEKDAIKNLEKEAQRQAKIENKLTVSKANLLFVLPPSGPPDLFYPDEEITRWEESLKRAKKVFTKEWFREQLHVSAETENGGKTLNFKLIFLVVLLIAILFLSLSFLKPNKTSIVIPKAEVKTLSFKQSFTNEVEATGSSYPNGEFAQGKVEIEEGVLNIFNERDGEYDIFKNEGNVFNIIAKKDGETENLKISEKIFGLKANGEQVIGEVVEEVRLKNDLKEVKIEDLDNLKQKNESLNLVAAKEKEEELKKNFT